LDCVGPIGALGGALRKSEPEVLIKSLAFGFSFIPGAPEAAKGGGFDMGGIVPWLILPLGDSKTGEAFRGAVYLLFCVKSSN